MATETTERLPDQKPLNLAAFKIPPGEGMDTHSLNGYYLKTARDEADAVSQRSHPETANPEFLVRLTPEAQTRQLVISPNCRLTIEMVDGDIVKSSVNVRNGGKESTLVVNNGADPLTGEHSLLMFFPPEERDLSMIAAARSKVSLTWLDAKGQANASVLARSGNRESEFRARKDYVEVFRASSIVARGAGGHHKDAQILIARGGHVDKLSSNGNVYIETPRGDAGPVPHLLRGERPPIGRFDINGETTLNSYLLYYPGSEDGLEPYLQSYRALNAGLYSGEYSWNDLTRMATSRYRSGHFRSLYARDADRISAAKIAAGIRENRHRIQAEERLRDIKARIEDEDREAQSPEHEEPESAMDRFRSYLRRIQALRPQYEPILTKAEQKRRERIREQSEVVEYVNLEHRPLREVIEERYRSLGINPDAETLRLAELLSNVMTVTNLLSGEQPVSQATILTPNALRFIASPSIESFDPDDAQAILDLLERTENQDSLGAAWNRDNQALGRRIIDAIKNHLLVEAEVNERNRWRRFLFWRRRPR